MSKEPEFNLTDAQKIAFGERAIKEMYQEKPWVQQLNTKVFRLEPDMVTLSCDFKIPHWGDQQDQSNLVIFRFKDNFLRCETNGFKSNLDIDISFTTDEQIQSLYFDYMYEIFGEPFRKAALTFWRERNQTEYTAYQVRKAQLNQEGKDLVAKHKRLISTLSNLGKADQKLGHFAAPDMPLRDAAVEQNPDREM